MIELLRYNYEPTSRAGFSWWEAWGPAIGVGDGGEGGGIEEEERETLPPPKKRINPGKIFSGKFR